MNKSYFLRWPSWQDKSLEFKLRILYESLMINWQPTLTGKFLYLRPLAESDFDVLFLAAQDPLIWEQHPDRNRYLRDRFQIYFDSALKSSGALVIQDQKSGEVIGSSRFYNFADFDKSVEIGFTFLIRKYWGTAYNQELKRLMLDYAFQFVQTVYFVVGINNFRSRRAMEKIGGVLVMDHSKLPLEKSLKDSVAYEIKRTYKSAL